MDNKKKGYISLHRCLMDDPIWHSEPFTRAQAWVDLIMLAQYKDGYIRVAGHRIDLKRGQCGQSETTYAKRWKWSRGKVRRFLSELETMGWISKKQDNRKTVITICKYNDFQDNDTSDGTANEHQTDSKQYSNNKDNNYNNNIYTNSEFEFFEKPPEIDDRVWNDFTIHADKRKLAITHTMIDQISKEAKKVAWSLEDALAEMAVRGWKRFDAEWVDSRKKAKPLPKLVDWQKKISSRIGYDNFMRWFLGSEFDGESILFDKKFMLDKARDEYSIDVERVMGREIQFKMKT